jgi:TPR repeat protein
MTRKMQNSGASGEELFRDAELKEERGDFHGAFKSLLAAAKLGDVGSQINLGNFYAAGRGVKKNLLEAARWYKQVYRNGQPTGALNLAVDLEKQGNIRGAVAWLKRAIAMNDGDAHLRLARIYQKKRNGIQTAISLLEKAILLSPSNISDQTREQADKLLKRLSRGKNA